MSSRGAEPVFHSTGLRRSAEAESSAREGGDEVEDLRNHRLVEQPALDPAGEGLFLVDTVPGREGVEYTAFDYDRCKDLPVLPDIGEHSAEELWERYEYFLKAVIPVAEEVGVRMAVHPNDPPPPIYRGCEQILGSVDGLKRLINFMPSPANGITWHTGVMTEVGGDPVDLIPVFMKNDQINHIHFRNVLVEVPRKKYTEVFIDEGQVDMAKALRTLRKHGYSRHLYPDHVPHMQSDVERGKGPAHY